MTAKTFAKLLSANDVGATGSHQAGILVPKTNQELLSFFPRLDPAKANPDTWIIAEDESGREWRLRYVYYNNRLHSQKGTRNEYRLTHLTGYLGSVRAKPGDLLVFVRIPEQDHYRIAIKKVEPQTRGVIALRGWRRVH